MKAEVYRVPLNKQEIDALAMAIRSFYDFANDNEYKIEPFQTTMLDKAMKKLRWEVIRPTGVALPSIFTVELTKKEMQSLALATAAFFNVAKHHKIVFNDALSERVASALHRMKKAVEDAASPTSEDSDGVSTEANH